MIKVGIIGGSGYTGGELIKILINHPDVILRNIVSKKNIDSYLYKIHKDLLGDTQIKFTNSIDNDLDVVFLCTGHGVSKNIIESIPINIKIIDLSQDFRLFHDSYYKKRNFIYGLPEFQKKLIKNADNISNPGCFATCIQLGLLPLANNQLIKNNIHISSITGSTGSGKKLQKINNFSYRINNISNYKIFTHQHLNEIKETIIKLQKNFNWELYFIPYRGNFSRGIISTIYTDSCESIEFYKKKYKNFYKKKPFVHISNEEIFLKQVIGTNKCIIHISHNKGKIIITSIIDNLLKGASGQAVQNFNIMFGLEEDHGLKLNPISF